MTATLRLERGFASAIWDRKTWQVVLDGDAVETIALKGTVELSLEPGRHTLRLTSAGKRRSPELSFEAADETVAEFTCHPQPIWPLALIALARPGHWLVLKQH